MEPVERVFRVAVKPVLGTCNGTPAGSLVDKRLRHQGNLITEHPRQGNALDQILAAFIFPAVYVKIIGYITAADLHQVVIPMIPYHVSPAPEHQFQPEQDIAPE